MADRVQISGSEWDVMEVIWEAEAWIAADVIKRLRATHDWNHSTIRTLLARLVEKGALDYEVDGPRYIYRAALSRRQCVRQEGRSFVDKVFRGDVGALLMHFVQDAALEPDQIDELRSLLDEKQPRRRRKGNDR
jgi:BlaI family penicillinase repressor